MKIDEALKLSDVVACTLGTCVTKSNAKDWYHCVGRSAIYSLHELTGMFTGDTWQPAYVRPQFQVGEKVSFLQACLSGQCFVADGNESIRRCIDIKLGKMKVYNANGHWVDTTRDFCPSDICTIVADPSQEQPEPELKNAEGELNVKSELEQLQDSVTDLDYRICLIGDTLRELVDKLGATKNGQ